MIFLLLGAPYTFSKADFWRTISTYFVQLQLFICHSFLDDETFLQTGNYVNVISLLGSALYYFKDGF